LVVVQPVPASAPILSVLRCEPQAKVSEFL
jgi:hypothetical protein